uniref:Fucosyltransferase n=1 Tax=Cyprinus carpio TaxID=7962 RepID=A0A8C1YCU6_CYPCA
MSTSRCGKICITPPKCSCKEKRHNFSSCSIVVATPPCCGNAVCLIVKVKLLCLAFQKRMIFASSCLETFTPSKGKLLTNNGCYLTVDRNDIKSDLLNLPTKPQPFLQKWIWMHFESPRNTRRLDGLENLFNVTLIYRRDADIVLHEQIMIKTEDTEEKIFPKVLDKKDKLVCWIVGNWNEKHERVKYYNELKKHINIYAFGGKLYLSFENTVAHFDLITEKLLISASGSCGSTIHERFVLKDAFIHVKDFSSPQKLAEHLLSLDKNVEEYKKYFQRRKHFEVKLVNYPQERACCSCQYTQTKKDYQGFGNLNKWYWIVIKDGT